MTGTLKTAFDIVENLKGAIFCARKNLLDVFGMVVASKVPGMESERDFIKFVDDEVKIVPEIIKVYKNFAIDKLFSFHDPDTGDKVPPTKVVLVNENVNKEYSLEDFWEAFHSQDEADAMEISFKDTAFGTDISVRFHRGCLSGNGRTLAPKHSETHKSLIATFP